MQSKYCLQCKQEKPLTEFHKAGKKSIDGVRARCKFCVNNNNRQHWPYYYSVNKDEIAARKKISAPRERRSRYKRLYGITLEQYAELLIVQGGLCAICGKPDDNRLLSVDHNHKTGQVRGLLCSDCNLGVGSLLDTPNTAKALINYAEKWVS